MLASSWVTKNASNGAAILTWTITGSNAVGSLTLTYLSSSGDFAHHNSVSFSGTVSGKSVNLSFGGTNIAGTVTSTQLSIAFPQSDGQISNLRLIPGTMSTYNSEVASINNEANTNERSAQAAAEAQQQEQAAAAEAQQQEQAAAAQNSKEKKAIQNGASTVNSDLSGLQGDESQLSTDVADTQQGLGSENTALSQTKAYLATTQSMVNQYGTGSGNGVCYEAEEDVGYEANEDVAYDATQDVGYDATQDVLPGIASVQSEIQQLQSDFSFLQSAESALPDYVPSGTPTSSQVQSAISAANTGINSAVSTTNGYIAKANAYVSIAYGYVDTAYQVGNCGSPPSLPAPVPTISASEASSS
ncbi:hypothetical protein [Ferrimicrobium sp.]|uniref:hypothetical protein n=1 Tax=Ferrimicrobium sp. TaxID=2926050 RepID=UPI00261727A7|nr:hypothetical protein [Ferrimicrobium sp.]